MKVKFLIELVVDGSNFGYDDPDPWYDIDSKLELITPLEKTKYILREEGFFGIFDVSNQEFSDGIKSVEILDE